MFKRYILFFIVNILISATLFTIARIVMNYFQIPFGSYAGLFILCFSLGMGGSFISLLFSKKIATMGMQTQELNPSSPLVQKVHSIARRAKLEKMPEVYVFQAAEINAFATGPSRNNSMVAVSSGLLNRMNEDEVEGVLAHEVAHIANGDMVTMTLIQGVVTTIAMFLSYIVSNLIMNALRSDDDEREGMGSFFLYHIIHNMVYGVISLLGLPIVMWVSRWREFRADAGSAQLVGKDKMVRALEALKRDYGSLESMDKSKAVMAISSKDGLIGLFRSHPTLEERINALHKSRGA